jgi:hypothetical protein
MALDFSSYNISVQAGDQFALLVDLQSNFNVGWSAAAGDTYAGGYFFGTTNLSDQAISAGRSGDMEFATYVASAVPEPGAWAMLMAGFGLTGLAMRKRKSRVAIAA